MKRWPCFLSIGLAFTTATLRATDDPVNPPQPVASFATSGSQVNGTVTVPRGQCYYGGLRSNTWQGYMYAFAATVNPATPLKTVEFEVRASIERWAGKDDKILAVAGGWKLLTAEHDPAWNFNLVGSTSQGHRVGTDVPEKPRSITLHLVYVAGQPAGQSVPVATWTIAYPGKRKADVITLDLLTSSDHEELASKIQTRNTTKFVFAEIRAHMFD